MKKRKRDIDTMDITPINNSTVLMEDDTDDITIKKQAIVKKGSNSPTPSPVPSPSSSNSDNRPLCKYGEKCYR